MSKKQMDPSGRSRFGRLFHSGVFLGVLVLAGFGTAFLFDGLNTNATYRALLAHHVSVPATVLACSHRPIGLDSDQIPYLCSVRYSYAGHTFQALIPGTDPKVFIVDPQNPNLRMRKAAFDQGPGTKGGDLLAGSFLLAGAAAVTAVHQLHLYRWRRNRRRWAKARSS